ncbi:MAG: sigma-70 family RNA polymerase sigma factor [Acidimicrobiales bacterium]
MTVHGLTTDDEDALVALARTGDERAYEVLIERHRAELHAHCYRMLASVHDADDAVQEALIRAWRALPHFEGRSSIRTWLFKIATNSSFDVLKKRSRRELPIDYGRRAGPGDSPGAPLLDVHWIEPYPDQLVEAGSKSPHARYEARESLELAFISVVQNIPPRQRAVLILRDVLGYSAQETSELLDASVAAVNSALQRARATLTATLPPDSQSVELARLADVHVHELARRYASAIDDGDIATLMTLLTEDATWSMPPHPVWYHGTDAIREFLADDVAPQRWRHRTSSANGQLAVGCYLYNEERQRYVASVLDVLSIRDGMISSVTGFISAYVLRESGDVDEEYVGLVDFARFDLPEELVD